MSVGKTRAHSLRTCGALCAGFSLFWIALYYFGETTVSEDFVSPMTGAEWRLQDVRLRQGLPAPTDPRVVFLGFDQQKEDRPFPEEMAGSPALQSMSNTWPWSRAVWAEAIERLASAGAEAIIVDLLFPNPGVGDDILAQTLKRHADKVVLGYNIVNGNAHTESARINIYPSETLIGGVMESLPILGYVNFYPDADDVIRRVTYRQWDPTLGPNGSLVESLAAKALHKAGLSHLIPAWDGGQYRFRYAGGPNTGFPYRPIYEIFVPSIWQNNYDNGAFFKGKMVLIGPAANWTQDLQQTPYLSKMFGPEVHANALNAALTGSFIREPSPVWNLGLIAACGLAAFLLMALVGAPVLRVLGLALISTAFLFFIQWLYSQHGWMIIAIAPILCFNTSGAACLFHQFLMDRLDRARTRANFEKYVSANVVASMLDRAEEFDEIRKGTRLPCTMLFSDLRGFTTLTESADSKALVVQLNEYFTEMVEAVFRHDGTLDKFIGDAVMAVWGNVTSAGKENDARNAVFTALDMLDSLDKLNAKWTAEGKGEFHIGIGLNHGEVIAADMGSTRKKEFTVIGDAVNMASRLEGATKEYGLTLILGQSVADLVRGAFPLQTVDLIRLKGKTIAADTFTILRQNPDLEALAVYEHAIRDYRAGRFTEACDALQQILPRWKHNQLPHLYLERCQELLAHPPASWDGVFVMKTK
ncbi:MAG: adenylate/guanylate cyclase domain-containing protein [Candidatus Methylacidiphilales bacterium]|nr:adenylate/guanylate cyclase domain-containing protein [Candidatus Methylacidiphilales bacterium]